MYSNINFNVFNKTFKEKTNNIIIISHINPDGDAVGSSLGLFIYFKLLKQNVNIIFPTDYPNFLKWLPKSKEILILSRDQEKYIKYIIQISSYIFLLDFNNYSRISPIDSYIKNNNQIKIMIDHHIDPAIKANFILHDHLCPSTSILIYKFIENMGDKNILNQEIATCLYTGIATDTGFFRYSSVNSETHIIIAKLLDIGVNINNVNSKLSSINTYNRMNLLGQTLLNMKILNNYRTVYMVITNKDFIHTKSNISDTEGFVNYGLKIKNIILSVIFIEEKRKIKVSFRSKGNFDVNQIARKYFNGGGHKNASGGKYKETLENSINYFINIIYNYKNEINKIKI